MYFLHRDYEHDIHTLDFRKDIVFSGCTISQCAFCYKPFNYFADSHLVLYRLYMSLTLGINSQNALHFSLKLPSIISFFFRCYQIFTYICLWLAICVGVFENDRRVSTARPWWHLSWVKTTHKQNYLIDTHALENVYTTYTNFTCDI